MEVHAEFVPRYADMHAPARSAALVRPHRARLRATHPPCAPCMCMHSLRGEAVSAESIHLLT